MESSSRSGHPRHLRWLFYVSASNSAKPRVLLTFSVEFWHEMVVHVDFVCCNASRPASCPILQPVKSMIRHFAEKLSTALQEGFVKEMVGKLECSPSSTSCFIAVVGAFRTPRLCKRSASSLDSRLRAASEIQTYTSRKPEARGGTHPRPMRSSVETCGP